MPQSFIVFVFVFLLVPTVCGAAVIYDVRDYGAKGDGKSKDTAAMQAAIDAAEKQGGGEVAIPAGRYLCGTLHLKSDITLRLGSGATLAASTDQADFDPYERLDYDSHADHETTYSHYALLAGDGIHDVAIVGQGTIDGNRPRRGGPKPIAFKNCQHITIRDITLKNAPNYNISLVGCDQVNVDGVTILNGYADGIDPDCSRFVRISNCFVDSADDAICLKASLALGVRRSTEHVTITNCILSSGSNAFKMGTESSGDFRNIAVSNCAMLRREDDPGKSGLAIESVDGSVIDGLVISNIVMQGVHNPLFIRLGNRGRGLNPPVPGSLENVSITNVVATGAEMTCSITGLPGHPVKRVTLDNVQIIMAGGEKRAGGLDVPEVPEKYPECDMFGTLPAYGVYARHVEGLTLQNLRADGRNLDARPALVCDDVRGLDLDGFKTDTAPNGSPVVWLHQANGAFLHGCRVGAACERFLRVTGSDTKNVRLFGNDLPHTAKVLEAASEVPKPAIRGEK